MPWARAFAERFRLLVELLAVVDVESFLTSVEQARRFDKLVEQTSAQSKAYLERLSGRFVGLKVKRTVEQGNAADIIVEKAAANQSTLIAMTTHGRSGLNRWLLGSVTEKVLRATTNPLMLVRASSEGRSEGEARLRSIVAPLDGSELAEKALPIVAKIAKKFACEIFLFRAYSNPYSPLVSGGGHYAVNLDELLASVRDEARSYLDGIVAKLKTQGVEQISYLLQEGTAANEIVAVASDTQDSLIVMSSHGRSGVKRWVLGSVAENVMRHSNSPVLVLRNS